MYLRSLSLLFLSLSAYLFTSVFASSTARNHLRFLAKVENPRIHTGNRRIHSHSSFDLSLSLYDGIRKLRLSLEPNDDVIQSESHVNYLRPDGSIRHSEYIDRKAHKVYRGVALQERADGTWTQVGWARVMVKRDGIRPLFEGAFSVNHDSHHIQTCSSYSSTRHPYDPEVEYDDEDCMVVWRDSDVSPTSQQTIMARSIESYQDQTCLSESLEFNVNPDHPVFNTVMRRSDSHWGVMPVGHVFGKRQIDTQPGSGNSAGVNLISTIGQTSGCPDTRKVALVGVATDCTYTGTFNSSESARSNVINQMNTASGLWESTFNISLGLQNLTVSDAECPGSVSQATPWNQNCQSGADIQARLNLFSGWRGQQRDGNSHWTLLTNCNSGSAVGLAWLGQACNSQASTNNGTGGSDSETVSGANVVAKTSTEWQVISHETGHTFGAVHDCTSQTCSDGRTVQAQQCCSLSSSQCDAGEQYIMNPFTVSSETKFSPCSIGNICSGIGNNAINTTCLSANKGVVTISGQQCGNGIVEDGEDCDCGGESGCEGDPCCDAKTCKFKGNSVCDDANEDCCSNCQFASAGTVCRPSTGDCNPAETCTGSTATCPPDITAPDGQTCKMAANESTTDVNTSELKCASGQCTSRDLQCQTVMGGYTNGSNDTYACDDSTCTMSCASPAFGPGACYGLQQNLLDGTPCGGGGKCRNGLCSGSTVSREVSDWIDDHKGVVIGVSVAAGLLLLLIIGSCIISCCRRPRRPPPGAKAIPTTQASWYGPAPGPQPVPMHSGEPGWRPPRYPPPGNYGYGQGYGYNQINGGWPNSPNRGGTAMRYA